MLFLGGASRLPAEDHTTTLLDGVTNNLAGSFTLGDAGPFNFLMLTNGGALISTTGIMGNSADAHSNLAFVTDTGSLCDNSGEFVLGATGAVNQLALKFGGKMRTSSAIIGSEDSATNKDASLDGVGTSWRTKQRRPDKWAMMVYHLTSLHPAPAKKLIWQDSGGGAYAAGAKARQAEPPADAAARGRAKRNAALAAKRSQPNLPLTGGMAVADGRRPSSARTANPPHQNFPAGGEIQKQISARSAEPCAQTKGWPMSETNYMQIQLSRFTFDCEDVINGVALNPLHPMMSPKELQQFSQTLTSLRQSKTRQLSTLLNISPTNLPKRVTDSADPTNTRAGARPGSTP